MKKQIHVVGAVIVHKDKVLCTQRGTGPLAGHWEFPGGKIEPGETPPTALEREIREELRCTVTVGDRVTTTAHEYDFGVVHLTTYMCELRDGEPTLTEHSASLWLAPRELPSLSWAPADVPAVKIVAQLEP